MWHRLDRVSIRTTLIATMLAIGAISLAVIWFSGSAYRKQAFDDQRAAMLERLRAGLQRARQSLEAEARVTASALAAERGWRQAWERNDAAELTRQLTVFLARHRQTTPGVDRLSVLDANRQPIANAPPGSIMTARACESLRAAGERRSSGICVAGQQARYIAIMPLTSERASPHIEIAVDWLGELKTLEATFNILLRVSLASGELVYESPRWTFLAGQPGAVRADEIVPAYTRQKTTLRIESLGDASILGERLDRAQWIALAVTLPLFLVVAMMALLLLQRTAIAPLRHLTNRLRVIWHDQARLGEPVRAVGSAEVVGLAQGFNDMTHRLRELYQNLEQMAFTDPLTRLPNRALFHDRLQQLILTARRERRPFALFIMDLDHFKDINDTLGHHAGDALLQHVADRLRGKLRESDTVARMGGDEFAVLLPTATSKHATMAARLLLQALRAPFKVEDHDLEISASIGIALFPDDGVDAKVLVQRADVAMYAAKSGGGGYSFYDPRLDQHSTSRLALISELRRALEHEQFELHYQPKINLASGRVSGLEALVRWNHPREGLLIPERFIPLLEQTGMIRDLTPWLTRELMQFSRRLGDGGVRLTLSANLSARDVRDVSFPDMLSEQLAATQADASLIEFEFPESAVTLEPARALETLERLARLGFRLAIDNFGTGYSSLARLKTLAVGAINIDRSFVTGMAKDANDVAIVRTSIDLAHNLGLGVVAEGVETADTLEQLRQLGCDTVQGHYLSRPLPSEELMVWLERSSWGLHGNGVVRHLA